MIRETVRTIPDRRLLAWLCSWVLLGAALVAAQNASAQELEVRELEDLVSPVALYPDDLLGIILPAATFPLEIVSAARFLDDLEDDPTLVPDPEWDDSVVALLNYPEVLRMMDENIEWTWELGEAVLTDQAAVLDAAQDFRNRAYAAGNLESDDRQTVTNSAGTIAIAPANPEVIYVPVYEPREIVVYQPAPIWHYYPVAYPVYYYPYPAGYSFSVGFFWGVTSWFSIGWHSHYVHVHHHTHYEHPYYLNTYYSYTPYYPRNHVNVTVAVNNHDHVWLPSPRRGNRPETVTVAGRTSAMRMPRSASLETQGARSASVESHGARLSSVDSSASVARSGSSSAGADSQRMVAGDTGSSARNSRAPQSSNARAAQAPARMTGARPSPAPSSAAATNARPSTDSSPSNARSSSPRPSTESPARMAPQSTTRSSSARSPSTEAAPRGQGSSQRPATATQSPSSAGQRPSSPVIASAGQPSVSASTRSNASSRSESSAAPRGQGSTRSAASQGNSSASRSSQR